MRRPLETWNDLTAQELPAPPAVDSMIEVDDICDVDPLLRTGAFVANAELAETHAGPGCSVEDSVEIELTAEQIVELLEKVDR